MKNREQILEDAVNMIHQGFVKLPTVYVVIVRDQFEVLGVFGSAERAEAYASTRIPHTPTTIEAFPVQ